MSECSHVHMLRSRSGKRLCYVVLCCVSNVLLCGDVLCCVVFTFCCRVLLSCSVVSCRVSNFFFLLCCDLFCFIVMLCMFISFMINIIYTNTYLE